MWVYLLKKKSVGRERKKFQLKREGLRLFKKGETLCLPKPACKREKSVCLYFVIK